MHAALIIALLAGDTLRPGVAVKDEGTAKGQATTVNCTGTAATCSVGAGGVWTLDVTGSSGATPGGVVGNLQTNDGAGGFAAYSGTGAAPANQWLRQLSTSGSGTWGQIDWTDLSGKPATFPATTPVATASALAADGADCVGVGEFAKGTTASGVASGCAVPPGTYTLPDAAAGTTGGVRLTGDLGGTATSPSVVDDSHAHTGTTISALDTGDITTGTLAGARGGGGAALPTCSGTDKLTANGTSWSCATDQTSAGGGYATVQDEGSALTARTILNFAGAGVSCADDTTRTTCTIAGGSGSPGSPTSSLQYNNAGAFGGITGVLSDGAYMMHVGTTTHPAAPAAGVLKEYAFQHSNGSGPPIPQWVDGTLTFDHSVQPFTRGDDAHWGCVLPGAWNSAVMTPTGSALAGSATGTAGAVAWAATSEYTRHKWVNFPQASSAINLNAGLRANVDYVWRGNAAGIGGFYWWGSFAINTTDNTSRLFVGLKDATAVLTATADPTAALDTVFFGCNNAQTTMRVCSNDNASTATCADLGANFPCTTTDTAYDVAFWAAPNAASVGYYIRRYGTAFTANGTISTDLPRNTVQLGWDFNRNTGGTADAIAAMRFGGTCWMSNP